MVAALAAVVFTAVDFVGAASAAAGFTVADFAEVASTEIGFAIITSTTGFSSLTTLETHSFTIPIHTTDIIPTVIIRMATAMDTVVFAAGAFETFTGMPFITVAFTAVALMAAALTAMPHAAVDDS